MGLLDISGFFTGLIINLLLITLVCYYFKRKYENIESAQMEQAKVLYELLQKQQIQCYSENEKIIETTIETTPPIVYESDSTDSEESDDDESDMESIEDKSELIVEQIKQVTLDNEGKCEPIDSTDYNKMSVKYLRDLLSTKGIKTNNKMKKNELISLATNKKSLIVDLAFENEGVETKEETKEEPKEEPKEETKEETKEEEVTLEINELI